MGWLGDLLRLLAFVLALSGQNAMAADLERLRHFPLIEAIRLEAARQIVRPILSGSSSQDVRQDIDRYPVDIRTSLLLGALAGDTRFGGLSIYFLASMRGAFAPEIADAMGRAGMDQQKSVFLRATQATTEAFPAVVPPAFSTTESATTMMGLGTQLHELSEQFKVLGDLGQQVEAFVRSRRDALDHFEKARQGIGPDERLRWLDIELVGIDMPGPTRTTSQA
jgi:hypothetical protein